MTSEPSPAHRAYSALREAVPTRRHAEMLFDMVFDNLGDGAWIETVNGEARRTLFRRVSPGSSWIIPWPLIRVTRGGREGPAPIPTAVPGVYEEPKPRPGPVPKLRGLGAGELDVYDGRQRLTISFGGDGRWFEGSLNPTSGALDAIPSVLAGDGPSPAERIARVVATADADRHGPARVRMPVPLPLSAPRVWIKARDAIREALFRSRVPREARWICADGWKGEAVAWGGTRDEAVSKWRDEVARVQPFPERPIPIEDPEPPEIESYQEGNAFGFSVKIRGGGPASDVPWVEPSVENAPCGAIELPELPASPAPIGDWVHLVGEYGATEPAALLWEPEGFTLVGGGVGPDDLERLESHITEADAKAHPWPEPPPEVVAERPAYDCRLRVYRLVSEAGEPVAVAAPEQSRNIGLNLSGVDPERLRGCVARMRPLET